MEQSGNRPDPTDPAFPPPLFTKPSAPHDAPTNHPFYHSNTERNGAPHSLPRRKPVPAAASEKQPHRTIPFLSSLTSPHHNRTITLFGHTYSRRPFLLVLAAVLLSLLALILGLSIGLTVGRHHHSHLPLPTTHGGPFTGDLTYYSPALGACGVTSSPSAHIVSISHILFDAYTPAGNPNANPLCGLKIRAQKDGTTEDLTVVDRCVGCKVTDLDISPGAFQALGVNMDVGRTNVTWVWLEDVPAPPS